MRERLGSTAEPALIAEVVVIRDGIATLDERDAHKQPDWSYGSTPQNSGSSTEA